MVFYHKFCIFVGEKKTQWQSYNLKMNLAIAQSYFLKNIFDRIPQDHLVRLVKKVVEGLNINHILKHYKTGDAPAYHHRVMIKILFYSYLSNIYSCRKITKALNGNIHFMYIAGNSTGY